MMRWWLSIVCCYALLASCAPPPAPPSVVAPAPADLSADDLADAIWTAEPMILRVRQTALFRFRGREVPMVGMMELNTGAHQARLVAVNEMGIKLFDLTVGEETVQENYLLPELERYPRFSEAVAASLRRIFLVPLPRPDSDALENLDGGGYRLAGEREEKQVSFLFGGEPVRLVEKRCAGEEEMWRVVYLDYRSAAGISYPREIVLEDRQADYRLDLRIESVKRNDEQTQR